MESKTISNNIINKLVQLFDSNIPSILIRPEIVSYYTIVDKNKKMKAIQSRINFHGNLSNKDKEIKGVIEDNLVLYNELKINDRNDIVRFIFIDIDNKEALCIETNDTINVLYDFFYMNSFADRLVDEYEILLSQLKINPSLPLD